MKLFTLILALFMFSNTYAASIGGIELDLKMCRDVDKWSGVIATYSNVQFPISGAPGITTGLMQNTSIIVDYCQFLTQMGSLDTQGQISKAMDFANKQTGENHNDEINLYQDLMSFTNQVYDFESGKGRKGAFESASTHRQFVRLLKSSSAYYDKNYAGDDPIGIQSKREAERDMNRLSKIAYQRALIKEAMSCPKPKDDKDYGEVYQKEIVPQQELIDQYEVYTTFYRQALASMGPKFLNKDEHRQYLLDLNRLSMKSSFMHVEVEEKTEETTKLREKTNIDPNNPTEEKTETYQENLKFKYQLFTVRANRKILQDFIKKYSSRWKDWTTHEALQGSRGTLTNEQGELGFLDGNRRKVEDEFKDFSIMCNRGRISQRVASAYGRDAADFRERVNTEYEKCKKESATDIKKTGGLLTFYANDLYAKEKKIKELRGNIWTAESFHLGHFRTISEVPSEDSLEGITQQEVQCAPIKNLAVMNKLSLKQQAANAELNQIIVEQLFKQNQAREAEIQRRRKAEEEARRRAEIEKEMERRRDSEYHRKLNIPEPRMGF